VKKYKYKENLFLNKKNTFFSVLGLSFKNRFWTFINVHFGKAAIKPPTIFFKKVVLLGNGLLFIFSYFFCDDNFYIKK